MNILAFFTRPLLCIICMFACILAAPLTLAHNVLTEYEALYQLQWRGLNVGTSVHTLKKVGYDRYVAQAISKPNISLLPFRSNEKSEFFKKNDTIVPLRYEFENEEKGKKLIGSVYFDWDTNEAIKRFVGRRGRDAKGEKLPSEMKEKLTANTLDKVTYTLALRQDLLSKREDLTYKVIEPKKTKSYTFKIIGEEKLKTPMGEFNTVKLEHVSDNGERVTQIWMAKDFDYLMIKLVQIKKDKLEAEAVIKELKVLNAKNVTRSSNTPKPSQPMHTG